MTTTKTELTGWGPVLKQQPTAMQPTAMPSTAMPSTAITNDGNTLSVTDLVDWQETCRSRKK